jgi:hypothetical protein
MLGQDAEIADAATKLRGEVDAKTFREVTAEIDAAHDQLAREHKRLASEAAMPELPDPSLAWEDLSGEDKRALTEMLVDKIVIAPHPHSTHPADVIDVFVYVVVLNLAIQYLPAVISETFTLSLLTAALLKATLELVLLLNGAVLARLRGATTRLAKATSALMLWVVAAGSKLVVLWLIDIVFGGAVSLGGFIPVTLLVIALLVSRAAVRRLLYGTTAPD